MENLSSITNKLSLKQSELFSEVYESHESKEIETFNEVSINNLNDWYNSILTKYNFINKEQEKCLQAFFLNLIYILATIDPEKLRFEYALIEETDVMIWRESSFGISKLVFDEYGQITYAYNGNNGEKVKGVFDINVDMEKLLYRFIAK
nr:hypothetical protein [uncultured Allomuricauda sp.]